MDERVARCLLIAKVLAADGIITDEEREFLETTMDAFGLDPHQRQQVRDLDGWDEAEPVVAALSLNERRALMDGLLQAVLADGKISPHETETIARLSQALGLS
jgi:uncharacterized tellurite resistance protein B-like protein